MERHSEELQDPWLLPGWVIPKGGMSIFICLSKHPKVSHTRVGGLHKVSTPTRHSLQVSPQFLPSLSLIKNPCPSPGFFYPFISSFSLLLRSVLSCSYPGKCFFFGLQFGISKVWVIRERSCGTIPHPPLSLQSLWDSGLLNTLSVSLPAQLFHARRTSLCMEFGGSTPSGGKSQASCMQELQDFINYSHLKHSLLKRGIEKCSIFK